MAHPFQPLLLEDLEIRLPGMRLLRLALHQHMPSVEQVDTHQHSFHQCLLYLRGRGLQRTPSKIWPVHRGSLVFLPARNRHSFTKERHIRPVCLIVDFQSDRTQTWSSLVQLPGLSIQRVEQSLFRLHRLHETPSPSNLALGAQILEIVAVLQEALANPSRPASPEGPFSRRVQRHLETGDLADLSPSQIARELGIGLDQLNRQLRSETGSSVGKILAHFRLARACHQLRDPSLSIGEVGAEIGYLDQNYFARWFRRHTGQSPSQWRAGQSSK